MPLFPQVEQQNTQQIVTDSFLGYDHQLKLPDGEFYDTKNLTTDYAPLLANRRPRGFTGRHATALIEKDALAYVGTDGTLYYNWTATGLTGLHDNAQLVSMGAYICVFPDKKYINTENLSDYGSMEASFVSSATYSMCRYDGDAITPSTGSKPTSPTDGQYWMDTTGEKPVLRQWSETQQDWMTVESVFIKISFTSTGVQEKFSAYDGVEISGSSVEDVNGDKVIEAIGDGWIMVTGLLPTVPSAESITVQRTVPALDFVCECQNRLWGCFYGWDDNAGHTVNEIYCCALGDFKNWRQYQGLSTDSWTGSVGSDGQWTGAVNYLGYPTFFKENRIHRVTVSTEGAHRIDETVCRGVQKGSDKSLVVVNETLYYKSRTDICAYQGGFPSGVSQALGQEQYTNAAAGAVGSKYYISMLDENGDAQMFVYDIVKGIWLHEDGMRATAFARVDNELFAVTTDGVNPEIVTMLGSLPALNNTSTETGMTWEAVSGIQYYEYPENKRLHRYNIRMKMAAGASVEAYLQYDSSGEWVSAGSATATDDATDSFLFPIRPHRCDHLQIKLTGSGDVRIYSIAKILEVGSDYR